MIKSLHTLPFSSFEFFYFMLFSILFVWISKLFFKKFLPYKFALLIPVLFFAIGMFSKPFQLIGLFIYLFISLKLLIRFYKKDNLIIPMLILSFPMLVMKYLNADFFESTARVTGSFKLVFQIAGLSYIVFKTIGLYIDKRSSNYQLKLIDFLNFSLFTPTLLIGPIDRFDRFQKDIDTGYANLNGSMLLKGWGNFVKGILFKFILATFVHRIILLNLVDDGSFVYHVSYMFTYLFYLFFDFAGYSLLAIAFGNFIGINVPINFDKPFLAKNPKELWKHWHITLGDWLNDYFFKPIFKFLTQKKKGTSIQRQGIALFLTFTLMGVWNGFELHFIASGMLFGLYSVIHNYYVYRCKKTKKDVLFGNMNPTIVKFISILVMVICVAFAIYIFSGKLF